VWRRATAMKNPFPASVSLVDQSAQLSAMSPAVVAREIAQVNRNVLVALEGPGNMKFSHATYMRKR
jgi:hypothetical protein